MRSSAAHPCHFVRTKRKGGLAAALSRKDTLRLLHSFLGSLGGFASSFGSRIGGIGSSLGGVGNRTLEGLSGFASGFSSFVRSGSCFGGGILSFLLRAGSQRQRRKQSSKEHLRVHLIIHPWRELKRCWQLRSEGSIPRFDRGDSSLFSS